MIVSEALEERLGALERTHADVLKDSDVDEQFVMLVRDAARIAIERGEATSGRVSPSRATSSRGSRGRAPSGETVLRERILRGIHIS